LGDSHKLLSLCILFISSCVWIIVIQTISPHNASYAFHRQMYCLHSAILGLPNLGKGFIVHSDFIQDEDGMFCVPVSGTPWIASSEIELLKSYMPPGSEVVMTSRRDVDVLEQQVASSRLGATDDEDSVVDETKHKEDVKETESGIQKEDGKSDVKIKEEKDAMEEVAPKVEEEKDGGGDGDDGDDGDGGGGDGDDGDSMNEEDGYVEEEAPGDGLQPDTTDFMLIIYIPTDSGPFDWFVNEDAAEHTNDLMDIRVFTPHFSEKVMSVLKWSAVRRHLGTAALACCSCVGGVALWIQMSQ
jgi:hypothetical protein